MAFLKGHWQLLALVAVIFALWQTPVIVPLKILVVLLHELAHALAAILTGGSVEEIGVSERQGGFAVTRGGIRFFVITAGYVGSLLIGVALLIAALRSRTDRAVMVGLGMVLLAVAGIYTRDIFSFGFTSSTGLTLMAIGYFLPSQISDLSLRTIGLTSMIYVPYDIFDDTIRRAGGRSDARILAEEIGGATLLWGVLWLLVSLLVIGLALRHLLGRDSNLHFSRPAA